MVGEQVVPLLLVSGPVGVGKTTVSEEVSNLLVEKALALGACGMNVAPWNLQSSCGIVGLLNL